MPRMNSGEVFFESRLFIHFLLDRICIIANCTSSCTHVHMSLTFDAMRCFSCARNKFDKNKLEILAVLGVEARFKHLRSLSFAARAFCESQLCHNTRSSRPRPNTAGSLYFWAERLSGRADIVRRERKHSFTKIRSLQYEPEVQIVRLFW